MDGDPEIVDRFDFIPLGKATRTPQGFLRFDANLTRTGVLEYRRADGSIQRELRLPEEVFSEESLATMSGAPVTDLHADMVTPTNVRKLQVGIVSEQIKHDDKFVQGRVTIQDQEVIDKVDAGHRRELSPGYQCFVEMTPGEYNGERYDGIQRQIRYNHLAIGPKGWGRSGSEVALRLDGTAAASLDTEVSSTIPSNTDHDASVIRGKSQTAGGSTMKRKIRVDGVEFEVEANEAFFQAFDQHEAKRADEVKGLTEKVDAAEKKYRDDIEFAAAWHAGLEGKFDAQSKELTDTKAELAKANDPKRLDEMVEKRTDLVGKARAILGKDDKGKDVDLTGKTEREIKEMVLVKLDAEVKLDGKPDEYVDGLFDFSVKAAKVAKRADGAAGARAAATPPPPNGGGDPNERRDARTARDEMLNRSANAWRPAEPKNSGASA